MECCGDDVVAAGGVALASCSNVNKLSASAPLPDIDTTTTRSDTMRPATRISSTALRRAVRTPLRAQPPANWAGRATAASQPVGRHVTAVRAFSSSTRLRSIMPDAENPAPPKNEETEQPTTPSQISEEEFHERADAYLNELVERLEEAQENDPQIEVEYSVWLWYCL